VLGGIKILFPVFDIVDLKWYSRVLFVGTKLLSQHLAILATHALAAVSSAT